MSDAAERHRLQVEAWDGPMGQQWALGEARTERALVPVTEALLAIAAPRPGERVLDIGCGCGGSSLAFARAVGSGGEVIGADVSTAVLEVARGTAVANTRYIHADAAGHDFSGTDADLLTSRFGVMFFGDPDAAFGNLRRALKPSGRLAFACWRSLAANPWVRVPMQAMLTVMEAPPRPGPEDPGPFAFGDPARVTRILTAGGFTTPTLREFDFDMLFPADPEAAALAISNGMVVGRMLRDQPDDIRAKAIAAIATAVAPLAANGYIRLGGAVWLVTAKPDLP